MGYYAAGDYYRGDPGLFGNILGGIRNVAGPKAALAPRAATQAAPPTSMRQRGPVQTASLQSRAHSYMKKAGKAGMPGAKALAGMLAGRRRRMNVLNPRALRKALRRAEGFTRFARRVVKITAPKRRVSGFKFRRRKRRT
jgi:hypothetical protein